MASVPPFKKLLERHAPDYTPFEELYKQIHANPELSWQEYETAATVARKLRELSPDVQIVEGIGKTGVIGILRNGPGKTLLLRADMDALPVREQTGLPYASTKEMEDADGVMQPVMHACGHDMHVTALLAAASIFISSRAEWSGILVFLFQPAEEKVGGALAMVKDGLYGRHGCPLPDAVLGQHGGPDRAGHSATRPGPLMAGSDQLLIKVYGRGGHASMPHITVDPVVLASKIVVGLQTIVSREVPSGELAVITVGSMHAGSAANVISEEAELKLSVRSVTKEVRQLMLDAIERIVRAECLAARSPRDPLIKLVESVPPLVNDVGLANAVSRSFQEHFGYENHEPMCPIVPASEDFSNLASPINKPYCFWALGNHDPADYDKRKKEGTLASIPSVHTPFYAPAIQPSLTHAAEAMVVATLTLLSHEGL